MAEKALLLSNPHLKYVEGRNHGYVILRINKDNAKAEWHYSENIKNESASITKVKEATIQNNKIAILEDGI